MAHGRTQQRSTRPADGVIDVKGAPAIHQRRGAVVLAVLVLPLRAAYEVHCILRAGTAACYSFWLRSGAPPARSTRHTSCKRASQPATGPAARQFCWLAALLEALSKKGARRGLMARASPGPALEISETVRRCMVVKRAASGDAAGQAARPKRSVFRDSTRPQGFTTSLAALPASVAPFPGLACRSRQPPAA